MFEFTGPWVVFAAFATLVVTVVIVADARGRRRRAAKVAEEEAYQLFAKQDLADLAARRGPAWVDTAYVSTTTGPLDERIVAMVVDPTLTDRDVATAIEHIAPGVGSLTAFAATQSDTATTRTPTEQRHLDEAWEPAHAEHAEWLDREFFADFDRGMREAFRVFRAGNTDGRIYTIHVEGGTCPHCTRAMHEITDEHRQIVSGYDTGAYDVRELRELVGAR